MANRNIILVFSSCEMKTKTLSIHWHEKLPVFSVDFEHVLPFRMATAGADSTVRVLDFSPVIIDYYVPRFGSWKMARSSIWHR